MTRTDFNDMIVRAANSAAYASLSEPEQTEYLREGLLNLPGFIEALDAATRDELAGFWPAYSEQIAQYPSARAAYENIPGLKTALDERNARMLITRKPECGYKYHANGEPMIADDLLPVRMTLQEVLEKYPEIITGPNNHLPVVVTMSGQFALDASQGLSSVAPCDRLDKEFWEEQFHAPFPWDEV